ncbi:MAG TPA: TetR/AcrR family transcriptional regulator [Spirochaetia bacterium]|nr:TetR/AcrR family transcriptional regulator [Spirochaetia bacterium]
MPRTEEVNQRIREAQRAKIMDGARRAFALKGSAATMADVAAAAEVSQGLAYRYFANKDEIFRHLVEKSVQSGPAVLERILEMPGTPGERLDSFVSSILKSRREGLEFHRLFLEALDDEATPADLRELVHRQARTYLDVVRQLIVQGQGTGEVAEGDPDQLVTAVTACLDGLTRLALRNPQFQEHFPDAGIILRMLKP